MRYFLTCLLLALFTLTVRGQELPEPIIKNVEGVYTPNRSDYGICWWCCAEMLGKHLGIIPLEDITKRVVSTQVGLKHGAREEDVNHWISTLKLTPSFREFGDTNTEWVVARLKEGLPVISSHNWFGGGSHAILLVAIGDKKVRFRLPNKADGSPGDEAFDYPVRYLNPNFPGVLTRDWTWFVQSRTGRAYTFDPRKQALEQVRVRAIPPLRPGRLMYADFKYHKVAYVVPTAPPIPTHALPYQTSYPQQYEVIILPSNQDIKDGVARPDDLVHYGRFYEYTPEYLKQFIKKK